MMFMVLRYITKVTDPTPNPSPTREGSGLTPTIPIGTPQTLPSPVGEGLGVGSVLFLSMFVFVLFEKLAAKVRIIIQTTKRLS